MGRKRACPFDSINSSTPEHSKLDTFFSFGIKTSNRFHTLQDEQSEKNGIEGQNGHRIQEKPISDSVSNVHLFSSKKLCSSEMMGAKCSARYFRQSVLTDILNS